MNKEQTLNWMERQGELSNGYDWNSFSEYVLKIITSALDAGFQYNRDLSDLVARDIGLSPDHKGLKNAVYNARKEYDHRSLLARGFQVVEADTAARLLGQKVQTNCGNIAMVRHVQGCARFMKPRSSTKAWLPEYVRVIDPSKPEPQDHDGLFQMVVHHA